jgi:gamma-glutamyl-gamma-aminobutyrate hydrolase PuuD
MEGAMAEMPVIGLNCDIRRLIRSGDAAAIGLPYVRAVALAGGVPLVLPPQTDRAALGAALARLDGLVLIGGLDLPPRWYGQKRHPRTRLADLRRLAGDRLLIDLALAGGRPLLTICLGTQLLNVALGGDLIQDIPSQVPGALRHAPRETLHPVRVAPGTRLAGILGREELEVNSSHHQAIGRLGAGLRAVAWAHDGIIEAVEGRDDRFLLGLQWHPERLADRPEHLALFRALVQAAGGG